ncbi:MAG: hypothetical protein IJF80_01350 [Clostridia bacterium]|nr:hypothetical protein [Clostridia bacterium]
MASKKHSRFIDWVNGDTAEKVHEYKFIQKTVPPHSEQAHDEVISTRKARLFNISYEISAVLVCVILVAVLLFTVFNLPLFGSAGNPASNEVAERYLEKGLEETGAVNAVAGMILDYRAFDTFGESSVLFIAVGCVMILLMRDKNNISATEDSLEENERLIEIETNDPILQKIVLLIVPCIFLFGIYVILNGHLSPGGGFSGGAIMGAGLILFAVSFGIDAMQSFFSIKTFKAITTTALMCYATLKAYSFFMGANGLETGIPLGTPGAILSSGLILVLDICVGLIVACTMYGFYSLFARGDI